MTGYYKNITKKGCIRMKKLRIKDKKLFKEQMKVIIMAMVAIIVTIILASYFRANGFESLFTIENYKEAFERNPADIKLINWLEGTFVIGILALVPGELKYNKELRELEREEEEIC